MKKIIWIFLFVFLIPFVSHADDESEYGSYASSGSDNARTIGGTIFGSVQLVDTLPVVDAGIGGGAFFDYRFNDRFSLTIEALAITQDGDGRSSGEGSIEFLAIPTATLKLYFLNGSSKIDPYAGIGLGFYALTEGSINNSTFGVGLGAQFEVGFDYDLTETLMLGVGGVYRSVGLINNLSGTANATTYMPFTLFGRIGYKF